jgi:hypothetical protein
LKQRRPVAVESFDNDTGNFSGVLTLSVSGKHVSDNVLEEIVIDE